MSDDIPRDIRNALTDARRLCDALGLTDRRKPVAGGYLVLCPAHAERDPSCSVSLGRDGTIRARCFSCDWTGDALTLVAQVRGLDVRSDFRDVLAEAAELAGMHGLAYDIRDGKDRPEYEPPPAPKPAPPKPLPDQGEVLALWRKSRGIQGDAEACASLVLDRRTDPVAVDSGLLARIIPEGSALPDWAQYQGKTWLETRHRMILPTFDADGRFASLRAWRIGPGDSPKRLPPSGKRGTELVLANMPAVKMLRGKTSPKTLLVVEGEPDFLSVATRRDEPTIGVFSGSWSPAFAERVPEDCDVFIWTHHDEAGDRYAARIRDTLADRCAVWRAA